MNKKKDNNIETPKVTFNIGIPTLSIDGFVVSTRHDNFILLRCLSSLPEGAIEQSRMLITKQHAINLINMLCKATGYFPKDEERTHEEKK